MINRWPGGAGRVVSAAVVSAAVVAVASGVLALGRIGVATVGVPAERAGTAVEVPAPPTPPPLTPPPLTPPPPVGAPVPTTGGPTTTVAGSAPGPAWRSGVYLPGADPAAYARFAEWRGRPLDVAVLWLDRWEWSDLTEPWILRSDKGWLATPWELVIGVPPFPEGVGGSLDECAAGRYDEHWVRFGSAFAQAGVAGRTILRLGWEFNGDWYQWAAHDPASFAECWRRVVAAAESTAPELRWDWSVNAGAGQAVGDAAEAYPGDAWVDYVGIDSYDHWPMACSDADVAEQLHGSLRLHHWLAFAESRGKLLSVPEWGTYTSAEYAPRPCPDNARYVELMTDFFAAHADRIAYESFFNGAADDYRGAIFEPVQQPAAAVAYRAVYAP